MPLHLLTLHLDSLCHHPRNPPSPPDAASYAGSMSPRPVLPCRTPAHADPIPFQHAPFHLPLLILSWGGGLFPPGSSQLTAACSSVATMLIVMSGGFHFTQISWLPHCMSEHFYPVFWCPVQCKMTIQSALLRTKHLHQSALVTCLDKGGLR